VSLIALEPDWPAPANVSAWYTERAGGVSEGGFAGLNLATHVGDAPEHVAENRRRLAAAIDLPGTPCWLDQVHGNRIVDAEACAPDRKPRADGAVARSAHLACAVLTADCLPVLLTDKGGTTVAAVHAGWRGLAAGVLRQAVAAMSCPGDQILAWLGPAISPQCYEVGNDVYAEFVARDARAIAAFRRNQRGRWQADLYALARLSLTAEGVETVFGGGFCTYREDQRFFSHRRAAPCGRMATLIWRHE